MKNHKLIICKLRQNYRSLLAKNNQLKEEVARLEKIISVMDHQNRAQKAELVLVQLMTLYKEEMNFQSWGQVAKSFGGSKNAWKSSVYLILNSRNDLAHQVDASLSWDDVHDMITADHPLKHASLGIFYRLRNKMIHKATPFS
jgi:hypothetical protein